MATNSKSKSSLFEREMQIDGRAVGIVIGKRGNTIKSFRELPGIVSVKFISHGKLHILGKSQQALDTVVSAVEQRVSFFFEKNGGYSPDFFTFCFCKSVEHPLLAVDKVCFEEFPSNISNLSAQEAAPEKTFFCVKSAELRENSTATAQDEVDILSAELADKTSKVFMKSHWDLSAYKAQLQSCLEPLFETQSTRLVKIFISFGKAIFHGANWSELLHGGFMPVDRLRDLCRRELLDHRFSTACSDSAVKDLKLLHLQTLGYQKMSSRKKITIRVADLQSGQLQFNVSVRCDSCEGLGKRIAISRERNEPKRHGFVTFCREGFGKTDFRVGVMTHATDLYPDREMVEWIRKAWRNRTPDGLLVFDPPGRFLVTNIWYKDSDNYVTVDWKFRIAEFRQANRSNRLSNKWDCSLSSRWIKRNVDKIGKDNMNLAMENLAELVNEAAKISSLMDVN